MNEVELYLEQLMDLKRPVTIKFRSEDGGVPIINGRIIKIEAVAGRQQVETDGGLTVFTDQILEINGRSFENIC